MTDLPADLKHHEPSKQDVEILIPERRQYGIVQGPGLQIIYPAREAGNGRFSIMVHPDHVNRVLRAIEGSKLAKAPKRPFAAEQLPVTTRQGEIAADLAMDPGASAPEPVVKVARRP